MTPVYFRSLKAGAILFLALIYSCSNSDEGGVAPPLDPEVNLPFDISVFAGDSEEIFQVDILANLEEPEVINLTQTLGVTAGIQEVQIDGSKFTFLRLDPAGYSFWQKDVLTNTTIKRTPICEWVEGENALFPLTSGGKVALLTSVYIGQQEWENNLNVYDPFSTGCSRFPINDPFFIHSSTRAKLHQDRLYLSIPEDPTGPSLIVVNANTGEHEGKLTFEMAFRGILSNEHLYILFHTGDYRAYRLSDLSLETEGIIGDHRINTLTGIFSSTFRGKRMVFDFPYPQPSPLSTAPAIFDWESNTITHGGDFYLSNAINSVAMENSQSLGLTVARVNLEKNLVVAGYKNHNEHNKGGVMYLNFDGEVLLNIPLDYVPHEIMIRN